MDTCERLEIYSELNDKEQKEFLVKHSHDKRFVSLIEFRDKMSNGFRKYLEEEAKKFNQEPLV